MFRPLVLHPRRRPATMATVPRLSEVAMDRAKIFCCLFAGLLLIHYLPRGARAQNGDEPTFRGVPLSAWIKALQSDDRDLRRKAAAGLIGIRGPQARAVVGPLVGTLTDKDRVVRASAARALGGMGKDGVIA